MTETQVDDRDNEIFSFIGISRKWVNLSLKFYSFLFLGYAIWISFQEFSGSTRTLSEILGTILAHIADFSVVEGITFVAIIQVVDIIMYLTNRFKTKVKKQVEEAKAEGIAEGRAQGEVKGEVKGRSEIYHVWAAWNARRMEAEAKNIPFDELPPELLEDTQDTGE